MHCHGGVLNFTQKVRENGGSWTIAFWVRPVAPASFIGTPPSERFFPQVTCLSSISPPQPQLTLGYWVNPNVEFRINSQCNPPEHRDPFWNIEVNAASDSGWTF